jgi:hypothetical protein
MREFVRTVVTLIAWAMGFILGFTLRFLWKEDWIGAERV